MRRGLSELYGSLVMILVAAGAVAALLVVGDAIVEGIEGAGYRAAAIASDSSGQPPIFPWASGGLLVVEVYSDRVEEVLVYRSGGVLERYRAAGGAIRIPYDCAPVMIMARMESGALVRYEPAMDPRFLRAGPREEYFRGWLDCEILSPPGPGPGGSQASIGLKTLSWAWGEASYSVARGNSPLYTIEVDVAGVSCLINYNASNGARGQLVPARPLAELDAITVNGVELRVALAMECSGGGVALGILFDSGGKAVVAGRAEVRGSYELKALTRNGEELLAPGDGFIGYMMVLAPYSLFNGSVNATVSNLGLYYDQLRGSGEASGYYSTHAPLLLFYSSPRPERVELGIRLSLEAVATVGGEASIRLYMDEPFRYRIFSVEYSCGSMPGPICGFLVKGAPKPRVIVEVSTGSFSFSREAREEWQYVEHGGAAVTLRSLQVASVPLVVGASYSVESLGGGEYLIRAWSSKLYSPLLAPLPALVVLEGQVSGPRIVALNPSSLINASLGGDPMNSLVVVPAGVPFSVESAGGLMYVAPIEVDTGSYTARIPDSAGRLVRGGSVAIESEGYYALVLVPPMSPDSIVSSTTYSAVIVRVY